MSAGFGQSPTQMSVDSKVSATDHAQVGQQVGVQFAGSVLHNATIYTTELGDPPDRLHEVARAHLDGGNPRRAEEILHGLFMDNQGTTERAYLYVLSILSDRPFTEVTAVLSDEIGTAMKVAASHRKDEWRDALDVIDSLLRYAHAEFVEGVIAQELSVALDAFGSLAPARQDEIDRHLNLILSGAVQERLTSERKYQVAVERMSGDRVRRAWMFFEANPRPPMKWQIPPVRPTTTEWRDVILGSAAMAWAIVCVGVVGVSIGAVVGLVAIAIGASFVLRSTLEQEASERHIWSLRANHQMLPYQQATRFDRLIDQCFREQLPGSLWGEVTVGYRGYLKRRLQHQYYGEEIYPGELKWLIMWHVMRAGQQFSYPSPTPPAPHRAASYRAIGIVVWITGLVWMVFAGQPVAAFLAVGGWWGVRGIARIASGSQVRSLLDRDAEALLAEEWASYHRWIEVLRDRPRDAEMARWLALDKAFLKDDALRRANLRERDLVTHVVLAERAPFARKGRVTDGPARYEKYLVHVFLLTQYGIRTTRTHLSLAEGEVRNEQRQMYTYDAVASASVEERGVRTFLADGRPFGDCLKERVFQLTLLNGVRIAEVRENARAVDDNWLTDGEGLGDVVSAQASGFDSALQVLEAVATEGRDWIVRDRERKQRWARNWCTEPSSEHEEGPGSTLVGPSYVGERQG